MRIFYLKVQLIKKFHILVLATALCLAVASTAAANIRVSFVNFYPGPEIYELEGHSALRITNGMRDVAVSYGTFDFDTPNFAYRFTKGETDYWVTMRDWAPFEQAYTRQGRRIVEHVIDLDSVQQARLRSLLIDNMLPQNRAYRYNYVKDNCSLRPLRLLQAALGDSIVLPAPAADCDKGTYRQSMRHYHANYPWYQFGIDLALGSGIDYPISNWEKAFAPATLDTQLDGATVGGRPLVSATNVLNAGADATLPPTPWWASPMCVSLLMLALTIAILWHDARTKRTSRWFYFIIYSLFGLAGLLLSFLVFVSVHEATSPNWLLLWLNPLCFIVPLFIWLKKYNIVILSYQIINFALLLVLAIAWPWTGQSGNPAFVPLVICDALCAITYIYVYKTTKIQ